jgi:hypothetical protein
MPPLLLTISHQMLRITVVVWLLHGFHFLKNIVGLDLAPAIPILIKDCLVRTLLQVYLYGLAVTLWVPRVPG